MAVGPTIGTGLFIGAGQALAVGGPASLLLSYIILSILTLAMTTGMAEVSTHMPSQHGTLVTNGYLYMSSSLAFASAYLRWYTLALFVPYEITSAMVNLGLWKPGATIAIRLVIITTIVVGFNLLPDKLFKSSERVFTAMKIATMATLFVLSLALGLGGVGAQPAWGFKYWKHPGAMNEYLVRGVWGRFLAFCQCLLDGSIAFTFAPELILHQVEMPASLVPASLGETALLSASIPGRVTSNVAQTALPYILSSLAMGVMAPFNETRLTNNGTGSGFSPYLIGLKDANIQIVPTIAMVAILLSAVASGRSFLYLSSRTLCAMSELGHAPSIFSTRNRWDVPYLAVAASAVFSSLAFVSVKVPSTVMNTYLLRLVTSAGFISSLVSFAIYRHFNERLRVNGITRRYTSSFQPFGTYFGIVISTILLLSGGLWAVPKGNLVGPRGARLITPYVNIFVFGLLFFLHRFQDFLPVVEIERQVDMSGRGHGDREGSREPRTPKTYPHRGKLDVIPEGSGAFELRLIHSMSTEPS
ncbi:Amino acid/polyamine transporter I [Penicillium expansum]|uniref:Amino acid/polyamine transporter I n=1 Tax=Penicillium expansum TaxID=27334 RepID=A0A0A2J4J1_PENEN|nr:Amino acid/polyamine transporter I [Penicillium expansum]KGO48713.1 Amino acid/polyamine transporter I [Penicillium expansum]KGO50312.1 Amino acid/polyamine transporter I [Penicillium expansum]KGO57172.1 Amino acid/polyamine transporter I [Penicillium expansum]